MGKAENHFEKYRIIRFNVQLPTTSQAYKETGECNPLKLKSKPTELSLKRN